MSHPLAVLSLLFAAACIAPTAAGAQAAPPPDTVISADQAVSLVAEEARLDPELRAGTATAARLSHVLADGGVVPGSWIVLVEGGDGRPAGIVGIDPVSGDFQFETFLGPDYDLPNFEARQVADVLSRNGLEPSDWELDRARLTFIGGKAKGNFWVVPHTSGRFEDYLAVPAFDRRLHLHLDDVRTLVEVESGRAYYRMGGGVLEQAAKTIDAEPPSPDSVFSLMPEDDAESGAEGRGRARELRATDARPGGPNSESSAAASTGGTPGGALDHSASSARGGPADPATGARRPLQGATTTDTSIIQDVPVYNQGQTNRCGKYALAMIHQWWSPEQLGSGDSQADEVGNYLGGSYGGGHRTDWRWTLTPAMKDVMNNWDQVDSDYQDFQTTWSGDADPIQPGSPTGQSDDLKSWIHFLDAPVAVLGDADGNSPLGHSVDHWVVVTGYSDATSKLYLNNSGASVGTSAGGTRGSVDYSDWNNDFIPHNRSAMVAGYPGDRKHATVVSGQHISSGGVEDGERFEFPVSLELLSFSRNDDAIGGTDAFGESYESTITVEIEPRIGWLVGPIAGDFDHVNLSPDSARATFRYTSDLSNGASVGNGQVFLEPFRSGVGSRGQLGQDSATIRRIVHDEDDRVHGGATITVNSTDDSGGTMQMPKPVLRPDTSEDRIGIQITDDDTDGPLVLNFDPSGGSIPDSQWPSGALRLEADVQDPSGLESVTIHYEVATLPEDTVVVSRSRSPGVHGSGTYGVDVPKSDWYGPSKITWRVEATDDDADRPGDRESSTSPAHTFYLSDDDGEGPTLEAYRTEVVVDTPASGSPRLEYTLEAQLADSSGVLDDGTSPRVYYRWALGHRSPTVNDTLNDGSLTLSEDGDWFRGTMTAPVSRQSETLFWRIKARDTDDDRPPSEDRTTSWSRVLRSGLPGELCVSPDPLNHDFGTVETTGNTTRTWSFTVENCGGEQIGVFGSLQGTLDRIGGSGPSCPHGAGGCWLSVSGLSGARGGALRLYGGETETISVKLNTRGHDYQVSALSPGRYETTLRVGTGQTTVRGTLQVGVPDSTGNVPDSTPDSIPIPDHLRRPPRDLPDPSGLYLGVRGGLSMTDLGGSESDGLPGDSLNGRLAGVGLRYRFSEVVGLETGVRYVERGGTLQQELSRTTVELTYVDVPLLLTLNVPTGSAVQPRLYAGGSVSFEGSCEVSASYQGDPFFSGECGENPDVAIDFDRPDSEFGAIIGAGLDAGAGPGEVVLSASYRSGRSALGRLRGGGSDDLTNRGLSFTAGYLFGL